MSFESDLRSALRRKSPPPDFTARVMAAAEATSAAPLAGPRSAGRKWAVAAMVALTVAGWTAHHIEERREGEKAKEQLMLALRVTSQQLHETREHLQR